MIIMKYNELPMTIAHDGVNKLIMVFLTLHILLMLLMIHYDLISLSHKPFETIHEYI
jgi:hypothetical protein